MRICVQLVFQVRLLWESIDDSQDRVVELTLDHQMCLERHVLLCERAIEAVVVFDAGKFGIYQFLIDRCMLRLGKDIPTLTSFKLFGPKLKMVFVLILMRS